MKRLLNRFQTLFAAVVIIAVTGAWDAASAQRFAVGLVVSDSEAATKAGTEILNRGGTAVDAAIATAFALSVADQASSGLGGGGFMVIYDAKARRAHALDFRETAPQGANKELYTKEGKPAPSLSLTGGLAVAVPGEVAGLMEAFKRFGTLPLPVLMAPSIRLASEGFALDPALRYAIDRLQGTMKKFPDLARVFMPHDAVPGDGDVIRQPELAETLKAIAAGGNEVFYRGWIAGAIVDAVKKGGGIITPEDLMDYKPVWREPLVGNYRGRTVITMPPPSSGGVALIEMLNVLTAYPLNALGHNSATYLHLVAEAMKHAFADRAQYLGDPDFVKAPTAMLLSNEYASWIRGRISAAKTYPPKYYGLVNFKAEKGGTTHFSVVDRFGNAVACTQSVNTSFGSKILAAKTGIVLNNEIDDFAIHPGGNVYGLVGNDANSLQPRKRPLSSMTPTVVLRGDRPEIVAGAAGGPRIISATLQVILNVLDFHMAVKQAVEAPRIHHQWLPDSLIAESEIPADVKQALERRGHNVRERGGVGVAEAIVAEKGKLSGAGNPRRTERGRSE